VLEDPHVVHANGAELRWSFGASPAPIEIHRGVTSGFTASAATRLTTITDTSVRTWQDTTAGLQGPYVYRVISGSFASADVALTTPAQGNARLTLRATGT
jgi:hypothetical protein